MKRQAKATSATGMEFRDLPEPNWRSGARARLQLMRDELRARPGEWAVIYTSNAVSTATSIVHLRKKSPTWAGFELTARGKEVFARYVGPGDTKPATR
jgi:hypothetical protein